MLRELAVSRFVLIEDLRLAFGAGLTVLTGETGAGKSMILHALDLLLGARASSEVVQKGAEAATVEGLFEVEEGHPARAWLQAKGFPVEGRELIIRRVVAEGGRGRAYVNGALAPVSVLAELARSLADVHGQHEQQSLLDVRTHRHVLDRFGGLEAAGREVMSRYETWQGVEAKRESLLMDEKEKARRLDLLTFQHEEIRSAGVSAGEDRELAAERARLGSTEKLRLLAEEAQERLADRGLPEAETALKKLLELERVDASWEARVREVEGALEVLRDAARAVRAYREGLEADPKRLEAIEDRLDALGRLKKKYGPELEDVLAFGARVGEERRALEGQEASLEELGRAAAEARRAFEDAAARVSAQRKRAASRLGPAVAAALREVGLEGAKFEARCAGGAAPGPSGTDEVEFLVELNAGVGLLPLARTASGGELSRVMLALRSVLAASDAVPVLVFDEVDAGIGGRVGEAVGRKLRVLAGGGRQVVCVTHLPQIASFADHHLFIAKETRQGRTTTRAVALQSEDEVIEELAKMLSGRASSSARLHAAELRKAARAKGRA